MDEETKKQLEEFQNKPPEEAAAEIFERLIKPFDIQINRLSKKGMWRVIQALIKVPLVDFNFKLDETEKTVYYLANRLLEAKFVMVTKVLSDEMKEAEKEARKQKRKVKKDGEVSQDRSDSTQEG